MPQPTPIKVLRPSFFGHPSILKLILSAMMLLGLLAVYLMETFTVPLNLGVTIHPNTIIYYTAIVIILLSSLTSLKILFFIWKRKYTILPNELIMRIGIISFETNSVFPSSITSIEVQASILQRIFGYGDLVLGSSSTVSVDEGGLSDGRVRWRMIKNPRSVKRTIKQLRLKNK